MERLTVNDLNKVCYDPWELCGMESYCTKGCHEEGGCAKGCKVLKIYRKLSEYEDLEERIYKIYGECDGLLETVVEHLERHENIDIPESVFKARLSTDGAVDRWEEYKALEKQGKLLKLPCAVRDVVYCPNKFQNRVYEHIIKRIEIDSDGIWAIDTSDYIYDPDDFGKTVFLTKEEAEAALKKMEESK